MSDSTNLPRGGFSGSVKGTGFFNRYTISLIVFSIAANCLLLIMPLYLAQVYDRVLPSSSFDTLFYLTVFALFCLALFGLMESLRSKVAQKFSSFYKLRTAPALIEQALKKRTVTGQKRAGVIADVSQINQILSSRAYISLFDLPFSPFFIAILFVVHPWLGWICTAGIIGLMLIALANEKMAHGKLEKSNTDLNEARAKSNEMLRHLDDVRALGMGGALFGRWLKRDMSAAAGSNAALSINASFFGIVRFARQALQVAILGSGAYLVLTQEMSAGMIFAASILSARALMPIEQMIGNWRQLSSAHEANKRVKAEIANLSADTSADTVLKLPDLKGQLRLENVTYAPEGAADDQALLKSISFEAHPGQAIAIVGPSGAGKSTLMRILSAGLRPTGGKLLFDNFDISQWDVDQLGSSIGYVGQHCVFFDGTIAENISRFDASVSDEEVVEAAFLAGAHSFIGSLPDGYQTKIGSGNVRLSGGQMQRVALARAFFRDPPVLLLDEPNAHLDQSGEQALVQSIEAAKGRGKTVIFVTQRRSLIDCADRIMVLENGEISRLEDCNPKRLLSVVQGGNKRPEKTSQERSGRPVSIAVAHKPDTDSN